MGFCGSNQVERFEIYGFTFHSFQFNHELIAKQKNALSVLSDGNKELILQIFRLSKVCYKAFLSSFHRVY